MSFGSSLDAAKQTEVDDLVSQQATRQIEEYGWLAIEALKKLEARGSERARAGLAMLSRGLEGEPTDAEIARQLKVRVARGDSDQQLAEWIRRAVR